MALAEISAAAGIAAVLQGDAYCGEAHVQAPALLSAL
jgi:hypothetical protein